MKKIISFIFCIMLVFLWSVPAYAASSTIHIEEPIPAGEKLVADANISIKAKVDYSTGLPEFPITNGNGGGKLPDGTEIAETGAPAGATYLVVRQIAQTETEPYKWFEEVLGDNTMQAYEIFFRDDRGNRISASGASIKVSIPDGMTEIVVYSLDPDNSSAKLPANIKDGKAIFCTDGRRYYVLTGTKSGTTPRPNPDNSVSKPDNTIPKPTPAPGGGKDDPPKTGDESNVLLWLLLAVVALIGIVICLVNWKCQKNKDA